jgi:hypothetical protein
VVFDACNPSTGEAEVEDLEFKAILGWLQSEFKVSLGYIKRSYHKLSKSTFMIMVEPSPLSGSRTLYPLITHCLFPAPPNTLVTDDLLSLWILPFGDIAYKWHHTVCGILYLTFLFFFHNRD